MGGNTNPTASDLKAILASAEAEADEKKIDLLLSEVTELIASGRERLATVPYGGSVAVASVSVGGNDNVAPEVEAKKEEKVEEIDGSDDDMCMNLFD